ncbi:hypothetical protein [Cellulomonas palmilytica]|nr:hypothetical protein [Cellulomonas palmilytica]
MVSELPNHVTEIDPLLEPRRTARRIADRRPGARALNENWVNER